MASHFDRWEKDPFFSAAEEVQESADRMQSTYRTWIHAIKDSSTVSNSEELRADLRTALGTTKWQLEEFERAVSLSYTNSSADDAKDRHHQFIIAIASQISEIESSLHESAVSTGRPPLPWVCLDEGECNELSLFLLGPTVYSGKISSKIHVKDQKTVNPQEPDEHSAHECSKNSSHLVERDLGEPREQKFPGHRRTASASADIGACKIAVTDEAFHQNSSIAQPVEPPRKIPSFSGFLNTIESASKLKWSRNGYRKLKLPERYQEADITVSRSQHLNRDINACYERSKSCLDSCDECYNKQFYGWYGAIQRQLRRSQYHMQYSRPIQMVFWIVLLLCLVVLFVSRAI